nr:HU family DNA-binding protein [Phreatobacter cathodiphilus]
MPGPAQTEGEQPVTKNELIAAVAEAASLTKAQAGAAVDATFDAIAATLKAGGDVKLVGFGAFSVTKRAAREGRDPRTGKPVQIKASNAPKFSAGKGLKDAVNS